VRLSGFDRPKIILCQGHASAIKMAILVLMEPAPSRRWRAGAGRTWSAARRQQWVGLPAGCHLRKTVFLHPPRPTVCSEIHCEIHCSRGVLHAR
jgi:hypothetical protein